MKVFKIALPLNIIRRIRSIIDKNTLEGQTDWDSVMHTIDFQRIHYPGFTKEQLDELRKSNKKRKKDPQQS